MGGEVKASSGGRTLGQMLDILRGWCWVEAGVASLLYARGYSSDARLRVTCHAADFRGIFEWEVTAGKLGSARHGELGAALAALVERIPGGLAEITETTADAARRAQALADAAASRSIDDLAKVGLS